MFNFSSSNTPRLIALVNGSLYTNRGGSVSQGMEIRTDISQKATTSNSVLLEHKGQGWEWENGQEGPDNIKLPPCSLHSHCFGRVTHHRKVLGGSDIMSLVFSM